MPRVLDRAGREIEVGDTVRMVAGDLTLSVLALPWMADHGWSVEVDHPGYTSGRTTFPTEAITDVDSWRCPGLLLTQPNDEEAATEEGYVGDKAMHAAADSVARSRTEGCSEWAAACGVISALRRHGVPVPPAPTQPDEEVPDA
jgi:hypothetical protein